MSGYDGAIDRTERLISLFLADGKPLKDPPGILLAELAPQGIEAADLEPARLKNRRALPFLTKWLIARSYSVRFEDPGEMLEWALMARLAAESCSVVETGSRARLADLRSRAWSQLANALRVGGRFLEAKEALTEAQVAGSRGTGDLELHAHLLTMLGSLQSARAAYDSAIGPIEEAIRIYEKIGETQGLAKACVQKAVVLQCRDEWERAINWLDKAISWINPEESSELLAVTHVNRARLAAKINPSEKSFSSFLAARRLRPGFRCSALLLRIAWQEGLLLSEIGHLESAEAAMLGARRGFRERHLASELVLISCDLASVYNRLGDRHHLEDLVVSTRAALATFRVESEIQSFLQKLENIAAR